MNVPRSIRKLPMDLRGVMGLPLTFPRVAVMDVRRRPTMVRAISDIPPITDPVITRMALVSHSSSAQAITVRVIIARGRAFTAAAAAITEAVTGASDQAAFDSAASFRKDRRAGHRYDQRDAGLPRPKI